MASGSLLLILGSIGFGSVAGALAVLSRRHAREPWVRGLVPVGVAGVATVAAYWLGGESSALAAAAASLVGLGFRGAEERAKGDACQKRRRPFSS